MPTLRLLSAVLLLSACASDPAPDAAAETSQAAETTGEEATDPNAGPFEPLKAPAQAARPASSAGTFALHYIRGSSDMADTTAIEGFLPPPVPSNALGSTTLDAVPTYNVSVKPSSVPDGVNLRTAGGYVWATVNEVGELKASFRGANSTLSQRVDGLFRGEAYAFTIGPLWTGGNVEPQLWIRDHEKEDIVLGEMPLPIAGTPAWAHPITLPTISEGVRVTMKMDLDVTQTGLLPLLIFPSTFGNSGWNVRQLEVDAFAQRRRERAGEQDRGTPYKVFLGHFDPTQPTAYLVLLRP